MIEEELAAGVKAVKTGAVRVDKHVHKRIRKLEAPLLHEDVEVRRVPVNRVITEAPKVRKKGDTVIAVKLVHKPSGRAIPDAVIFAKRIDMGPDKMADMQAKLDPVPGGESGVYQFKTNLEMAGRWALTLGAKVQGEIGTVQTKLIVHAR